MLIFFLSGVQIEGLQIRPWSSIVELNQTANFTVSWTIGSDVNFIVDFGDGKNFSWNWRENNHIDGYHAHSAVVQNVFMKSRDFFVSVTAYNDVGKAHASTNVTNEPVPGYFSQEYTYHPIYPPVTVTYTLLMNGQPDEVASTKCKLLLNGTLLDSLSQTVSSVRNATLIYTFHNTVPDISPTFRCYNHFSSNIISPMIILQQNVTNVILISPRQYWSTLDNVQFTATVQTGSDVMFTLDYKDGLGGNFTHPVKHAFTTPFNFTHNFTGDGVFKPSILAYNKHFNTSGALEGNVYLQNPVRELTFSGRPYILQPPGVAVMEFIPNKHFPLPTNITCKIARNADSYEAFELRNGTTHTQIANYTRSDVGENEEHAECWNEISHQNLTFNFTVCEDIKIFNVTAWPLILSYGETAMFNITMLTGSHVQFNVHFADGETQNYTHPQMFANESIYTLNHTFNKAGNFSATVHAYNPVSQNSFTMEQIIVVQKRIVSLTLTGNSSVLWTPGTVSYDLSLTPGQPELTDVHCLWYWGDNSSSKSYHPAIDIGEMEPIQHDFPRNACGIILTAVECWNLVSNGSASHTVHVILDEVLIESLVVNRKVVYPNSTTFQLTLRRYGTHSCFLFNFGDHDSRRVVYGAKTGNCSAHALSLGIKYFEIQHGTTYIKHIHQYTHKTGYYVSVNAFNHITYDYIRNRTVLLNNPCEFPDILYVGNGTKEKPFAALKSARIPLRPIAHFDCIDTYLFNVSWEAYQKPPGERMEKQVNMSLQMKLPPQLFMEFPPLSFPHGLVRVQINVSMYTLGGMWTLASTYLNITKTPLAMGMIGGSRQAIGWNRSLEINAYGRSQDPDFVPHDRDGWEFTYYCKRYHENYTYTANGQLSDVIPTLAPNITWDKENGTMPDFGGCFDKGPGRINVSATDQYFMLNTGDMRPNTTYIIDVMARRYDQRGTYRKIIDVQEGDPPILDLR